MSKPVHQSDSVLRNERRNYHGQDSDSQIKLVDEPARVIPGRWWQYRLSIPVFPAIGSLLIFLIIPFIFYLTSMSNTETINAPQKSDVTGIINPVPKAAVSEQKELIRTEMISYLPGEGLIYQENRCVEVIQ